MSNTNKFTRRARNALRLALDYAEKLGHTYIGSEHILLGLTAESDSVSSKLLASHGIGADDVKKAVIEVTGIGMPGKVNASDMTPSVKKMIERSDRIARRYSSDAIGTEHLLLAMSESDECVGVRIMESLNLSMQELKGELSGFIESTSASLPKESEKKSEVNEKKHKIAGCPVLSEFGKNLTALAMDGRIDPIIGREKETERMIQILSRRTKNNPCLIGEPGVGKTAVVEGLALRIADDEVPDILRGKIIITLDIPSMIAGAKYRGEFEERMKNVMRECARNPDIILFIDEIHTIIGAGGAEGAVDAANIIKPALARGEMQIIGATTISEYRRDIERDAALERRFQTVTVDEPTPDETEKMIFGLRDRYEKHHGLKISDEAIRAAVKLSDRYIHDRFLPDKAIDLVDEAASRVRIKAFTPPKNVKALEKTLKDINERKRNAIDGQDFEGAAVLRDEERRISEELCNAKEKWTDKVDRPSLTVSEEDVAEVITSWTRIPLNKIVESEGERLLKLSEILRERVIGQDRAIEALSSAIKRGRTGLSSPERPIGSFIFLGPTGVGKTELAKALAEQLFGSRDAVIRFDMSEYMEKHSVSKLIGSPPGYVGYNDGGRLTESVRRRPYSLLLFDEIEKADSDVFNLLLQVLDDGILTDSGGRRANFRNTVIIMTSNLGARRMNEGRSIGFFDSSSESKERKEDEKRMRDALRSAFPPEFLNRVDDVIVFSPLDRESVGRIVDIMLKELINRALAIGVELNFDGSAKELIIKEGYDPSLGARPLRRVIIKLVEDRFSEALLSGYIKKGDRVTAVERDGKIVFVKE